MTIRTDITVDFQLDPRLASIAAPSTEITVQDSHDTLTSIEDSTEGHRFERLVLTAGGEPLGGGTTVGLTSSLQNVQYAFDSTSPRSVGAVSSADALGITLIDSGATFISDGVLRGDWIINFTDKSVTEILTVDSETQVTTRGLRDGTSNTFSSLDSYKVWEVSEAELSGGNFVAIDEFGADINPLFPTFGRFITRTAASSATSQSQSDIEYSSFQGGVWFDENSLLSIVEGKNGNAQLPLNNIPACIQVQSNRGLPKIIYVLGGITLDTGDNVEDFKLIGISHINSVMTVNAGASCLRTSFESFDMTGFLDGDSEITNCIVRDLEYFNGHIHNSYLAGIIKLRGVNQANISNCAVLDIIDPPIIDAGGSGQDLMMPNFSGRVYIDNLTGVSQLGIGLDAGQVVINSTCIAGTVMVSGSGAVVDNSSSGCYVVDTAVDGTDVNNIQYLIESMHQHHTGYGKIIFWDAYQGDDTFDGAHPQRATKTFAQAHTLADDNGHDIILAIAGNPSGVTTVTEQVVITKNYLFLRGPGRDFIINGTNDLLPAIDISGIGVEISGLRVSTNTTNTISAIKCSGGFPLFKDIYIENSANGILIDDGEHGLIDNIRIGHNTGYAIKISGGSDHFVIDNSHIGTNSSGGIIVALTSGHEVTIKNTVIHGNTGYGIDILSGSSHTQILGSVSLFQNSLGNVRDLGTLTTDNSNIDSNVIETPSLVWEELTNNHVTEGTTGAEIWHLKHEVYIDTELLSAGDGSQHSPFNNLTTAIDFSEAHGIRELIVYSDITIDRQLKNFVITGVGTPTVDCNNQNLDKSEFNRCVMTGEYTGSVVIQESNLSGLLTLNGYFENCALSGAFVVPNGATAFVKDSGALVVGLTKPSFDIGGIAGTANLVLMGYNGGVTIDNCDTATCDVKLVVTNGIIELSATCTDGSIIMHGDVVTIRNDLGSNVTDHTIAPADIKTILSDTTYLKDIEGGKWELVGNQMIFYASDNITEVSRFNMFDSSGNPTTTGDIYKRERV